MLEVIIGIVFIVALWRIGSGLHRLAPQPAPATPGMGDKIIPLPVCFAILGGVVIVCILVANLPGSVASTPTATPTVDQLAEIKIKYERVLSDGALVHEGIRLIRVHDNGQLLPNERAICDELDACITRIEDAVRLAIASNFNIEYVGLVNTEVAQYEPLNRQFQIVNARVNQRLQGR